MEISSQGFMAMALAVLCSLTSSCGKAPPREYVVLNAPAPERAEEATLSATLIIEVIDVHSSLFEDWSTKNALIPDAATPLRKAAQAWIQEGDATITETLTLSVNSGSSSQIQSQQLVIAAGGKGAFEARQPGISLEASVTIDRDSRECAVQLTTATLNPDKNTVEPVSREIRSVWSRAELTTNISLSEMAYGFLGSCAAEKPQGNRSDSEKWTSLFFLRADTNLAPQSVTTLTSQL